MNDLISFRVDNHQHDPIEQSDCDEAIFAVIEAVVQNEHRLSLKQRLQVGKVNAVIPDIGPAFSFILLESHWQCSYTL